MSGKEGVIDFVAGGAGGVCQLVVGHPLDTLKVLNLFWKQRQKQMIFFKKR